MSDEPGLPGPGRPDPVEPAPDAGEPVDEVTTREVSVPEPTAPESAAAEPTAPEPTAPEPTAPEPDGLEPTVPDSAPSGSAAGPEVPGEGSSAQGSSTESRPSAAESRAEAPAETPVETPTDVPVEGGRAARRRAAEAAAAAAAAGGAVAGATAADDAAEESPFVDTPSSRSSGARSRSRAADADLGDTSAAGEGGRAARRRAAEEAARDSAQVSRHRALMVSGLVLGLLAVVGISLGGWSLLHRTPTVSPTSDPSPSATATGPKQPTLLVQVKTADGIAVDSNLTSVGGSVQSANMVGMPSTLLLDPATGGSLPLGQIARLPDVNASGDALSDATGITVDGTWVMDTLAFSGLVDAVGGVTVNVDVDVFVTQPDGKEVVLVPAGDSKLLEGPQAAAYATYLGPNEEEPARMARYQKVLAAVAEKLPADPNKIEAIVTALGASAKSSIPVAQLSAYLAKLHASVNTDDVFTTPLPTKAVDGTDPTQYRVDQKANADFVDKRFPDAKRTAGPNSRVRVYVQNGVGTPGLDAKARQLLVDAGFTFVNGGNAETFGHTTTLILIPDSTPESQKWGSDIATALKVPLSDVAVTNDAQTIADVVVVLGADFTPSA